MIDTKWGWAVRPKQWNLSDRYSMFVYQSPIHTNPDQEIIRIKLRPISNSEKENREWQFAIQSKDWPEEPNYLLSVYQTKALADFSIDPEMEELVEVVFE